MQDDEQPPVKEGDVVAGKYAIRRVLGQGGMGIVVEAQHLQLGHRVALKFLNAALCQNAKIVARFLREGQAVVRLESDHVTRTLDVGTLGSGAPYLAMEFLEGSDLQQVLAQRATLPFDEAIDYLLQACDAVAEAHSLGIIHRDLKPANLFLTRRRDGSTTVKVLDFGIAKAEDEAGAVSMTATNVVMGSPQYMSPEQLRSSKHVDARSDIWALGTILYELTAGRPVYVGETLTALCAMVASDPPPPLSQWRPDVPPALEAIIMRCLDKDPARRPQTVADLAAALLPFGPAAAAPMVERMKRLVGTTGAAPTVLGTPAAPAGLAATGAPANTAGAWANSGATTAAPKPTRAKLFVGVVGAIGLIGLGAGLLLLRATGTPAGALSGAPTASAEPSSGANAVATAPSTLPAASAGDTAAGALATSSAAPSSTAAGATAAAPVVAVRGTAGGASAASAGGKTGTGAPTASAKGKVTNFGGREY
jgi:eukaryotic-like serine/threonine-protein kinase